MTDLKAAVFTVLEGWALPLDARKILETAYYAQPEQSNYSDIVSDGGLDPRNKFDAQPEPVQVRPHEFIAMASKHPSLVGTPVIWAEYPTRLEHIFVAHDIGCAVNGYGECDCFGGVKA